MLNAITHGHTRGRKMSRTYIAWMHMRHQKKAKVCDRWQSFVAFRRDMGSKPVDRSLQLVDPTGIFEPGNAIWGEPRAGRRKAPKWKNAIVPK